nr:hypothetical protein [uncultured Actinotalea sp.]
MRLATWGSGGGPVWFARSGAVVLASSALVAAAVTTTPAVAEAVASRVTLSATTVVGGADFATDAYADPWDYANREDQVLVAGATTADLWSADVAGGRLVVDAKPGGFVAPVVSWADLGALPWDHDGSALPIDATRYTRMSVHMRVDRAATGTVMWFTCGVALARCQGAKSFPTAPGWHTYDIPLTSGASGLAWQGLVKGLRLYPSDPGGRAEIDWVRLYAPGQTTTVSFDDSTNSPGQVFWDRDGDAANNTATNPDWGVLDSTGSGTRRTVQGGALPSGTYRVGVLDDGVATYATTPLVVDGPPAPAVIDPDRTGGIDHASLGGNPWDFNDPGDVYRVGNADTAVANGLLYGTNRGPLVNDPHVVLSQYGAFDGSRFHRLTLRMAHEGGFSLEDTVGGGMNARLVWTVPEEPGIAQVSDDLVVYPGWHATTLSLRSYPPNAVQEPGTLGQAGWAGRSITSFRIDPNEDRGARRWYIDEVRLAEDDTAYGGTFDIRFRDQDWQPGTRATVRADTDRAGCDGAVIAQDVAVTQGVNTVRWTPRPVPEGTYWVCVSLTDGRSTTSSYATGPLQMTTRPSPLLAGGSPFGAVDDVRRVPGGLMISGWAIDPDTTAPTSVHAYVGQRGVATSASLSRPDVAAVHPAYGPDHGFSVTVPATEGTYDVCVYAINIGVGGTTVLQCRVVRVSSTPVAGIEAIGQVPGGVRFDGWAFDPDTADPIDVHAYAGRSGVAVRADLQRPDVAAVFPGYGSPHGFTATAPVVAGGPQAMCTYGINVGAGGLGVFGCPVVDVRVDPIGVLDAVERTAGGVRVAGWTLDPSTEESLDVHVYVGSAGTAIRADRPRPDLLPHFPAWRGSYGFETVLPIGGGPTPVCAYGINKGIGGHVLLGCRTV